MAKVNAHLWVVVQVKSGIPVSVDAFSKESEAETYKEQLQQELNPENDEAGLFFLGTELATENFS